MTEQPQQESTALATGRRVRAWLETQKQDIVEAWAGDRPEKQVPMFLQAVVTDCMRQPKLVQAIYASPETFKTALTVCANAGLLPGAAYDQFYLIPRKMRRKVGDQWTEVWEVTHITGYKGLSAMAYRNERVHSVEAFVVYKEENFEWDIGAGVVRHTFGLSVNRSDDQIVGAWAKAILTDPSGMHVVERPVIWAMTIEEIHAARQSSQAWLAAEKYKSYDSPWHTNYAAMVRKTVMRALLNKGSVPRNNEMLQCLSKEAEGEQGGEVFINANPELPAPPKGASLTEELGERFEGGS